MPVSFVSIALFALALGSLACTTVTPPTPEPPPEAPAAPSAPASEEAPAPSSQPEPPDSEPAPSEAAATSPPPEPAEPRAPEAQASPPQSPEVVEAEPAPEDEVAALPPEPAPPARAPKQPPIDLDDLQRRVRATSAIGPFTKLALKNEIDDLLDAFESFHNGNGRGGPSLAALRERFDLLVMKVVALLEDDDVRLASDLTRSREHLWGLVSDPIQFSQL